MEEVTRIHQADVYEMQTVERPEKSIAMMILFRYSRGKFLAMFVEDQSSKNREAINKMGMVRRLL